MIENLKIILKKIEKANNQTKMLDYSSNDIKEILNNLKSTKLNKIIWLFQTRMFKKSKIIQKM